MQPRARPSYACKASGLIRQQQINRAKSLGVTVRDCGNPAVRRITHQRSRWARQHIDDVVVPIGTAKRSRRAGGRCATDRPRRARDNCCACSSAIVAPVHGPGQSPAPAPIAGAMSSRRSTADERAGCCPGDAPIPAPWPAGVSHELSRADREQQPRPLAKSIVFMLLMFRTE
jgi:hypothetical protein